MKRSLFLQASLWMLLPGFSACGTSAGPQQAIYPPGVTLAEVRDAIRQVPPDHPRLFLGTQGPGALGISAEDPLRRSLAATIVRQAEMIWDIEPVRHELEGRRLLGQSRLCLKRVVWLATAYQLSGDRRHLERCEKEMLAAARFSDWNPSHFLDVAEIALALAIGYDWLFNGLGEASRDEIRKALVEKSVSLQFQSGSNGWVKSRNNWGQVCHGGLTAAALAILEDEPELAAKTVHSAVHNVTFSMEAYAPNGSYPEGPGYWSYGTSYNVVLIDLLETVLGSDFGLSAAPGFDQTGQYLSLVTGPSGLFFNYADGGAERDLQPALFWFASRYERPDWLLGESDRWLAQLKDLGRKQAHSASGRLLPLALLWMEDRPDQPETISMPLHWKAGGETPVVVHRSSWSDPDATFVGFKGGSPSSNHANMDIGSFVLDACGVRWAVDLGAEGYHGIESRGMDLWNMSQQSDRWRIFRQTNEGHNTLVIGGKPQRVAGNASFIRFSDDPAQAFSILDMTSVYEGQADSASRGIALLEGGRVLIQDELSGVAAGQAVRWGMITPASVEHIDSSRIELALEGSRLTLEILSPAGAEWVVVDTETPRNEWDSPNPGTRMAAFTVKGPESGRITLAVRAIPCRAPANSPIVLKPLADWQIE